MSTITKTFTVGNQAVITIDSGTYGLIEEAGFSAVELTLADGLQKWTKGKGVALEQFKTLDQFNSYILLLDNADQQSAKGKAFIKELRNAITSLGKSLKVPTVDPGTTTDVVVYKAGPALLDKANSLEGFLDEAPESIQEDDEQDQALAAYRLINETFVSVLGNDNHNYMVPRKDIPYIGRRAFKLGSSFTKYVAGLYYEQYKTILTPKMYGGVEDLLEYDALRQRDKLSVETRSFRDGDDVWIDLGQDSCDVVKLNADGWEVTQMPVSAKRAFVLSEAVRRLEEPQRIEGVPESFKELNQLLKPFVNVENADWPLIVGWMVNHLLLNNSPILMLLGTNGSGKSTACNAVNFAVEGGHAVPDSLEFSGKKDDVMVTLSKHKVAVFDNISKINDDLSDNLAQVIYGKTYQKRKLRTDDDLIDLYIKSSVIMNGISTGQLREDLKDRMVVIKLDGAVKNQTSIWEMKQFQVANQPRVYGALLTLASAVLRKLREDEVPALASRARMDDYARVLWALDELLGTSSVARYLETLDESADDAQDDPLLWHVVRQVVENGTYKDGEWSAYIGTKKLVNSFNADSETWANRLAGTGETLTARSIPEKLTRSQVEWSRLGVEVGINQKKRSRVFGEQQTVYPVRLTKKAKELVAEVEEQLKGSPEAL